MRPDQSKVNEVKAQRAARANEVAGIAATAAAHLELALEAGDRYSRRYLMPFCGERMFAEVTAELRRRGDLVAGRERGAPLYWQRTPEGIEQV